MTLITVKPALQRKKDAVFEFVLTWFSSVTG